MVAKKRAVKKQKRILRTRAGSKKACTLRRVSITPLNPVRRLPVEQPTRGLIIKIACLPDGAALILAEAEADPPFDLSADLTFESLYSETTNAVDDLAVHTSANSAILCQVKHTLVGP